MTKGKKNLSIYLEDAMRSRLEEQAMKERRSMNNLIVALLSEYLGFDMPRPMKWAERKVA